MFLPKHFVLGAATSAYQIEGAYDEGGRTLSIWDRFCREEGRIDNGDTGDAACDHYNRYREDIMMMKQLGLDSYRLSISWPRIFPEKDKYNPQGMQFYKDVLKELMDNGIKACVTIYHWDLPMWAQDMGGFRNRESISWFTEFAAKCFDELGDLVDVWITHNEPWCASFLSNFIGDHAPGKNDIYESLIVAHHLLLSHGEAVKIFRNKKMKGKIGITLNLSSVYPETQSFEDRFAAENADVFKNRHFLEPLFKKSYPTEMFNYFHESIPSLDFIKDGDMDTIGVKCDFLGVNYYTRSFIKYDKSSYMSFTDAEVNNPVTDMGWEVYPEGLYTLIKSIRKNYTDIPIYITENGCAYKDVISEDGKIHDDERTDYIKKHLQVVSRLIEEGDRIDGYYVWSLLDNFEWKFGYSKRFGIVYVDFDTQKRIPKESFKYLSGVLKEKNGGTV